MRLAVVAACAALFATAASAQTSPAAPSAPAATPAPPVIYPYGAPIVQDQARKVLAAAEAEARKNGWVMSFAVVDPAGELVAFQKMDGAGYGSIDVSQAKARSAARFGRETKVWADGVAAGRLGALEIDSIVAIEGGVPIVVGGKTIGAIGVSGATAAQDGQVGRAAAAAVQ
ncbi:heme-binding protein [Caulobacter sp. 17J65-9]|uniref:GlcG/HbpS family heme-binding protein n=1 Tax=Caulobacter sp. 17J65-9 TaxID=2709382 RepID=UPI0013C5C625|nr:heme-binding protein [Caulobacter sp. 17J65-9]NEX92950.1 heme-binding protein [Caulobacter sp. 17J65-9]